MKEILYNLANIDLINFCKTNNIDCSGTYVLKAPRGYKYTLVRQDKNHTPLVEVTFYKRQVPTHFIFRINL